MEREPSEHPSKLPDSEPTESSDAPQRPSQIGQLGPLLGSAFQLPNFRESRFTIPPPPRGGAAGIENAPEVSHKPEAGSIRLRCVDFDDQQVDVRTFDDVDRLLASPRPSWSLVRWIDVEGLHPYVVNRLRQALGLHTLAAEDVWHVPQRPKAELYGQQVFVIVQRFRVADDDRLQSEQVSAFATRDMLLTFQEQQNDIWGSLRARIGQPGSRINASDATYLLYAVLDTVVDHDFPILEKYGERLEQLEDAVLTEADPQLLREIHAVKRDLLVMRRVLWPMREAIGELTKPDKTVISEAARTYLRDVHDHCVQVMDILETFRELASNLTDLHLSMTSNKMNEVMKVLTIISTIFIPITFLAGVYGMNFDDLPELHWKHGYAVFWGICGALTTLLIWFFHKRGWLRG